MAQAATPSNGFKADELKEFITRCENIDADIASETGAFMKTIRDLKEGKKEVIQEAKDKGIPPKPLKAILKQRALLRDIEKIEDGLEGEDSDSLDAIRTALGDWAEEVSARKN